MSIFFNKNVNYFLKVVAAGSFKEAAWLLHLSQPALSIAIKNLEEELDCVLFRRDKKNAELTEKGRRLYEKLLALDRTVTSETSPVLSQEYAPKIRIGSIPWYANQKLLPILNKTYGEDILSRTQFFFRPAGIVRDAVERGKIDFAFINWPSAPSGVLSREIQDDPAAIGGLKSKFSHITKAKSYQDLENEPWLYGDSRGSDWTEGIDWDKNGYLIADVYSLRFLILGGYGIYEFQLAYFSKEELSRLAFAKFPSRFAKNKIYAIWREGLPADSQKLINELIAKLKA